MSRYMEIEREDPSQVKLFLRDSVLRRWGKPTVNFPSLSELIFEQAGLPRGTKIRLFSGRWVGEAPGILSKLALGGKNPYASTVYSGVGLNGTLGIVQPSEMPEAISHERIGAPTATMRKLVHNVLWVGGVRGTALYDRERELYVEHAGDIQFENPSEDAWDAW